MMRDAFASHVPIGSGKNPAAVSADVDTGDDPFQTDVCRKHRDFVRSMVQAEDKAECPSCVLFKLSFNEDQSSWDWDAWNAAVRI